MDKHQTPHASGLILLLISFCIVTCLSEWNASDGPLSEIDDYPFNAQLDDNYNLKWQFNSSHIMFKIKVKTNGYVGFGISENGAMFPSDIVIAWVSGGKVHFHDRHGTARAVPKIDKQQDWQLLDFKREDSQYNTLTVIRKLNTCDDEEDIPIMKGTTRIIYSYNDKVPNSDDSIPYHGPKTRGTKSLLLLDPPLAERHFVKMPDDVMTMDLLNSNYSVPGKDTTYMCRLIQLPRPLDGKHHLIRVDPVIQEGHEKLVHHMLVYTCSKPLPDAVLDKPYECYKNEPKVAQQACLYTLLAWAIGGTSFTYPSNAGQSMGAPDDPVYFKVETHFDNFLERSDYVDNSGFRLFLTKQLREHDVGTLLVGALNDNNLIVPPHYSSFLTRGYCLPKCLDKSLGNQELRVFANLLHSHLMGRKMATRIVRDGVELPPIVKDDHYDFDYQETRVLPKERVIKKGDLLITDCYYDSSKRTSVSYGGFSSREEMCLSFLFYYPKIDPHICFTRLEYKKDNKTMYPDGIESYINSTDWTLESNRKEFVENIRKSDIVEQCFVKDDINQWPSTQPKKFKLYVPKDTCHDGGNGGLVSALSNQALVFFSVFIASIVKWKYAGERN